MDDAKLKIVVKGRQTGFSFIAALHAVLQCLEKRLTWVLLSKGERQSRLLMEKVQDHVQAMQIAADFHESNYFEGTQIKSLEMRFPNGSVIYGLPANPDTARGYSGNVTLDEFAFHTDSEKIYSALYPTITRGYGLEVISTPNGQQGKFFELARAAGLVSGEAEPGNRWSPHKVSIYDAHEQGLPVDLELLRAGVPYDDDWLQEYCCAFISTAENFFPPELIAAIVKESASIDLPLSMVVKEPGEGFLGIDIGRFQDRTVLWLDMVNSFATHDNAGREIQKRIATARHVATLHKTPFAEQLDRIRELLNLKKSGGQILIRRACIDATGMGAPLAETLLSEFGGRVEPTVFTAAVKEDLAFRTKRRAENGEIEIPDDRVIRAAFGAVKKVVMPSGAIRFDAERTEAGHADEFWAKSLADLAADQPVSHLSDGALIGRARPAEWQPENVAEATF